MDDEKPKLAPRVTVRYVHRDKNGKIKEERTEDLKWPR